jgi:Rrf2 family protein
MNVSLKCQYAIRGVLELARRHEREAGAVPISELARGYQLPRTFLVIIMNELKRGGFVGSKRGARGGFYLAVPPESLTVGDIVRFIDGPVDPVVKCVVGRRGRKCPQISDCALREVWDRAQEAVERVYDSANFADLARRGRPKKAAARKAAD